MSVFSSDEARAISRDIARAEPATFDLDVEATAAHIRRGNHRRVALQFPDTLLTHASAAVSGLQQALDGAGVELFVLGDTSFDGFQVDFVAAQHFDADFIVHYGPVDLEARGPLPVRFVFGRRALDIAHFSTAFAPVLGAGEAARRVLVVPSLPYAHASEALAARLGAGAIVCHSDVERTAETTEAEPAVVTASSASSSAIAAAVPSTSDPFAAADALARGFLLGRRLGASLDEAALGQCAALVYLGSEDQTLSNLCLLLPNAEVYLYEPPTQTATRADASDREAAACEETAPPTLRRLVLATARRLMRRYYLVQQAREAEVVGILVGTLSASQRTPMLRALKALCRRAARKHYVFIMGKLNAAKLANFAEVGVYVLLGSAEHSLLDAKDFYRPVVTPYELHVALAEGAEWTGEYMLDYGRLLPRLRAAAAPEEEEEEGRGRAHGDDSEDEAPRFSELSGKLIAKRSMANTGVAMSAAGSAAGGGREEVSSSVGSSSSSIGGTADTHGTLVASGVSGTLARRGDYAMARTGAEALARREYRGLEPRLGEHAPSRIVEGRSGIASGFTGEGGAHEAGAGAGASEGGVGEAGLGEGNASKGDRAERSGISEFISEAVSPIADAIELE
ncbi:diphthamide biosynthesis protein [Chrysochromulina tobinii]|uniref:Diphthamide biosynthesis protein n=1 Tax=Chrysochromulina tobinii TaxID=1460289 RepID=A0A0M0K8X3_9EUKA|nr:diphthamide biosynthesis protein [Chrysochromulina tobinii]|eukprot:KOO35027.1 diphthamide biosynthesis protein [Chrysochromulina sp. CCMP291]